MSNRSGLRSELQSAGIQLAPAVEDQLALYWSELERWNIGMNLTGLTGQELVRRLIVGPVWLSLRLGLEGSLMDVGSGNGSPAIPMCLTSRLEAAHLVEVRSRKAAFLRHLVVKLSIKNAVVHNSRIEDLPGVVAGVDWITLQGVAANSDLMTVLRRISKPVTRVVWITSKGASPPPCAEFQRIEIPPTNSEALILTLDQT